MDAGPALLVAHGLLLAAPFVYAARRLGWLLACVPPYVAANALVLGEASAAFPIAAWVVGVSFGVAPLVVLAVCLLDFRFGLFATDLFWGLVFAIFGLLPLAPSAGVLLLLAGRG